jgi:putative SOS response-associated peptidase YedK
MSVPVVGRHRETGDRHLDALTWGLVPSFTKDLKAARKPINARAETLSASGLFRAALGRRRRLVPASAFYEWKTTPDGKVPHAIARADGDGWLLPPFSRLRKKLETNAYDEFLDPEAVW